MSRKELLWQSLRITARHPVFGIGAGNFGDLMYKESRTTRAAAFINHATHNTYTQYSSENGLVAAFLFIFCLGVVIRAKWQTGLMRDRDLPEKYRVAIHYTRLALIGIAVFGLSLSFAYKPVVYLFTAFMVSLLHLCQEQAARRQAIASARTGERQPLPVGAPVAFH